MSACHPLGAPQLEFKTALFTACILSERYWTGHWDCAIAIRMTWEYSPALMTYPAEGVSERLLQLPRVDFQVRSHLSLEEQ